MRDQRLERLTAVLGPVVGSLGCELWGIELAGPSKRPVLRLYIDADAGISLEDCERVSRQVSVVLEVEDPIPGEYVLEVSSPGMDRRLFTEEQCARYIGEQVRVRAAELVGGRRNFSGELVAVRDGDLVIRTGGEEDEYVVPFAVLERVRVVPGN